MPKLTPAQAEALRALGLLMLDVPAARRSVLNNEIRCLLEALGLDYRDHLYLLGERFRNLLPGANLHTAAARRQYYFEVIRGITQENPEGPYEWHGLASVEELAQMLGKTTKTIANWMTNKARQSPDRHWVLSQVPMRFAGSRMYVLRYRKVFGGEELELNDGLTIMDAMDALLDSQRIIPGRLPRGAY